MSQSLVDTSSPQPILYHLSQCENVTNGHHKSCDPSPCLFSRAQLNMSKINDGTRQRNSIEYEIKKSLKINNCISGSER